MREPPSYSDMTSVYEVAGIGEREHVARVDAEPFDFTLYVAAEGVPADAAAGVQR